MSATVPFATFLPGMQVYKYKLQRRIGFGSFGEVWLANDNAVAHDYAIKILRPGVPVHERLREAHIGADILRGLGYLHGQNFFHNDVKPENVLIGPQSQGMLTDYGIVGIPARS